MPTAAFEPPSLTIRRNESVTWTNTSGLVHNITFAGGGAPDNIPDHSSGSNVRTFTTTGTFEYRCTNHSGMNGSIIVQ
jgi:plastocyanin